MILSIKKSFALSLKRTNCLLDSEAFVVISNWFFYVLVSGFLGLSPICFGHAGHKHERTAGPLKKVPAAESHLLSEINAAYKQSVKPIFEKKCFDCHSTLTKYPWYHKVPGIHSLINDDVSEAQKHLDFTNDFPFNGHGSMEEDFQALQKVISDKSMPPWRYRLMHGGSKITSPEKNIILKWLEESTDLLHR